jgi:mannose-6-phosphate isomerase
MKIPSIIPLPPNRVWRTYPGGKTIDIIQGEKQPTDSHFPEDWIASTTLAVNPGREDMIAEGLSEIEVGGRTTTLKKLIQDQPEKMVGHKHFEKYGANLHFLAKFLDSEVRLHIQAHPTIEFSQKHLNCNSGKTEVYVILGIRDSVKDPYILMGFQRPPSRDDLKTMVQEQDIERLLSHFDKISIQVGDVFIVPGGLPHAIGEGVFMIEIMEPTDFVARLEFSRGGYVLPEKARFMNRDVDFGLDVVDFEQLSLADVRQRYFCKPRVLSEKDGGRIYILIDQDQTTCFSIHRVVVDDSFAFSYDSFFVCIVSKGSGVAKCGDENLPLMMGAKFLVPYFMKECHLVTEKELEVTVVLPPN